MLFGWSKTTSHKCDFRVLFWLDEIFDISRIMDRLNSIILNTHIWWGIRIKEHSLHVKNLLKSNHFITISDPIVILTKIGESSNNNIIQALFDNDIVNGAKKASIPDTYFAGNIIHVEQMISHPFESVSSFVKKHFSIYTSQLENLYSYREKPLLYIDNVVAHIMTIFSTHIFNILALENPHICNDL